MPKFGSVTWLRNPNTDKLDPDYDPDAPPPDIGLLTRLDLVNSPPPVNGTGDAVDGWWMGSLGGAVLSIATDEVGDKYLRAQYPENATGGNYFYGGWTPDELQQELYLQFYARMPSAVKYGCKFIKIFGAGGGSNYANVTFAAEYGSGYLSGISFGDGSGVQNDTGNVVSFSNVPWLSIGRSKSVGGTSVGVGYSFEDWGTGWHKIQMRVKYNSGTTSENEVNDGVLQLIVDDVVYGTGNNLFNRHPSNGMIETVNLFGWTQGATNAFEVHMKNFTISTGGWVDY